MLNVKIDEQSNLPSTQPHIRKQLRLVNRIDCLHTLDLNDDRTCDDEINAISEVDLLAFIYNRQSNLAFNSDPLFSKLV